MRISIVHMSLIFFIVPADLTDGKLEANKDIMQFIFVPRRAPMES